VQRRHAPSPRRFEPGCDEAGAALEICRRLALIGPTCPRLVPIGPYAHSKRPPGFRGVAAGGAIALCADERLRGAPITSSACRYQAWSLEVGAPAGLPPDAPPGLPGTRLGSGRTRPPLYVHMIIYAARGPLEQKLFPFAWPHDRAQAISKTPAASEPRAAELAWLSSLGWPRWSTRARSAASLRWRGGRSFDLPLEGGRHRARRQPSFLGPTPRGRGHTQGPSRFGALGSAQISRGPVPGGGGEEDARAGAHCGRR
jgi:hypothetical protein